MSLLIGCFSEAREADATRLLVTSPLEVAKGRPPSGLCGWFLTAPDENHRVVCTCARLELARVGACARCVLSCLLSSGTLLVSSVGQWVFNTAEYPAKI